VNLLEKKIRKMLLELDLKSLEVEVKAMLLKFNSPEDALEAKIILERECKHIEANYCINYQFNPAEITMYQIKEISALASRFPNLNGQSKAENCLKYEIRSKNPKEVALIVSELNKIKMGQVLKLENLEKNTFFRDFEANLQREITQEFEIYITQDFDALHFLIKGSPEEISKVQSLIIAEYKFF